MVDLALPYFVARPADPPPWPGVVVIHEGGGISPQLLRVCQRLAGEGYATVAPDLFFRVGGTGSGDFARLMGSLERERTQSDLNDAAVLLRQMGAGPIGVTGFCMGGLWTWRCAVSGTGFDAAVGFYGAGIARELAKPTCPTLLMFGGTDEYIPAGDIEAVVAGHHDTVVYATAGHGFMRDGSDSYVEDAATDAWARMLDFFASHLR